MKDELEALVELSQYAAQHPRFVQGGGGNCSVKFGDRMLIKASGYFLEDVTVAKGFAVYDLKKNKPVNKKDAKVSLETDVHKLLNTFVIHTHPIVVAALVCSKQGPQVFREHFPEEHFLWVDYAAPGIPLYEKVKETLSQHQELYGKDIALFLQNHGLFVTSNMKVKCVEMHEKIIAKLENYFETPTDDALPDTPKNCFFTPDHAVYSHMSRKNLSSKQIIAIQETAVFSKQVLDWILEKHWEPVWLSDQDIKFLLRMKEEKYRQQLWKK